MVETASTHYPPARVKFFDGDRQSIFDLDTPGGIEDDRLPSLDFRLVLGQIQKDFPKEEKVELFVAVKLHVGEIDRL